MEMICWVSELPDTHADAKVFPYHNTDQLPDGNPRLSAAKVQDILNLDALGSRGRLRFDVKHPGTVGHSQY